MLNKIPIPCWGCFAMESLKISVTESNSDVPDKDKDALLQTLN